MIELTTGVMFLMSSMYGAGHANTQVANVGSAQMNTEDGQVTAVVEKGILTEQNEIEAYIRKELKDQPILIEVAWCESRLKQFDEDGRVIRGRVNPKDVGVMQINEKFHAEDASEKGYNIYSLEGNVAFGKYLYEKYGTDPWKASKKCWSASGDIAKR